MTRVTLLLLASMGFGSALTIALTKPPVLIAALSAIARFLGGLFFGLAHVF